MSNVTYLHHWNPDLCIELKNNGYTLDFNRPLYKLFKDENRNKRLIYPSTEDVQQGKFSEDANRREIIVQLKSRFDEALEEGTSHASLKSYFGHLLLYILWCDQEDVLVFTQISIEGYMNALNERVMRGELKNASYCTMRLILSICSIQYADCPSSYFDHVVFRDVSDVESYEAYNQSDLKQLLPLLRAFFKQTHQQFINNPKRHMTAHKSKTTMTFHWKGCDYKIYSGINKMMAAACYLLAYYTSANTTPLFELKQPQKASTTLGETWYNMPVFKRRAFKTISIVMGEHDLDIPQYAIQFFDKLLKASKIICDDADTLLLQRVTHNKIQPMNFHTLENFVRWLDKTFKMTDQTGRKLRPSVSRFRQTGSQIVAYHSGDVANGITLGNTPNVRKSSYTQGNKLSNNGMMQDAMSIREEQVREGVNPKQAQASLGIDVLVIDQEHSKYQPKLSRTLNGGSCKDPFGEKAKKYTRKMKTQGLAKEDENAACADLLSCFGCEHQAIVDSVSDIWCLLSFRANLEESLVNHLDAAHYEKNFQHIIDFIDSKILPKMKPSTLKKAEEKLDEVGLHPFWDDEPESIFNLIPQTIKEPVDAN